MTNYQRLRLWSPEGDYITQLDDWTSIDCSLVEGGVGNLDIKLLPTYTDQFFRRDCRISYERAVQTGGIYADPQLVGGTCWLLTERGRETDRDGGSLITLHLSHPNHILGRRVVAYNEGTSQADQSDIASDVMYDIVNQNFVAATDTLRNLSSAHFVLDARPGATFGATISKSLSYRNVLTSLREICQSSSQQGAYIGFEVYTPTIPGPFRVRFYRGQRGANRGASSDSPLTIYPHWQSASSRVWEDWSDIASFVYSGGSGKQDERNIQTALDQSLIDQSPFGRAEFFRSVSSDSDAFIDNEGERTLREMRPRREFESDIGSISFESSYAQFGREYGWGDIVQVIVAFPIVYSGAIISWVDYKFDVRVDPVRITARRQYDENGRNIEEQETENISIHFRSVSSTT